MGSPDSTSTGGSSFLLHLAKAQAAIEAGVCTTAVIAYGSTQRSAGGRKNTSAPEHNAYEAPFRPFMPPTAYALAAPSCRMTESLQAASCR